ncbi:hypothetical protein C8N35_103283 [Breoghania corrubedonensis]|uniref:Uncharacterized protein n=1 Tax=Breoghania corrubedonensis TaxID=665038 RepID=A0A2T5VBH5_9HYPH|nr:hypothetical protein [Breoghania corrubedonensis]PTW61101.1 hypothetical protein C8N35_103283 [Breoghania corrubedonensis]
MIRTPGKLIAALAAAAIFAPVIGADAAGAQNTPHPHDETVKQTPPPKTITKTPDATGQPPTTQKKAGPKESSERKTPRRVDDQAHRPVQPNITTPND